MLYQITPLKCLSSLGGPHADSQDCSTANSPEFPFLMKNVYINFLTKSGTVLN